MAASALRLDDQLPSIGVVAQRSRLINGRVFEGRIDVHDDAADARHP